MFQDTFQKNIKKIGQISDKMAILGVKTVINQVFKKINLMEIIIFVHINIALIVLKIMFNKKLNKCKKLVNK